MAGVEGKNKLETQEVSVGRGGGMCVQILGKNTWDGMGWGVHRTGVQYDGWGFCGGNKEGKETEGNYRYGTVR